MYVRACVRGWVRACVRTHIIYKYAHIHVRTCTIALHACMHALLESHASMCSFVQSVVHSSNSDVVIKGTGVVSCTAARDLYRVVCGTVFSAWCSAITGRSCSYDRLLVEWVYCVAAWLTRMLARYFIYVSNFRRCIMLRSIMWLAWFCLLDSKTIEISRVINVRRRGWPRDWLALGNTAVLKIEP